MTNLESTNSTLTNNHVQLKRKRAQLNNQPKIDKQSVGNIYSRTDKSPLIDSNLEEQNKHLDPNPQTANRVYELLQKDQAMITEMYEQMEPMLLELREEPEVLRHILKVCYEPLDALIQENAETL